MRREVREVLQKKSVTTSPRVTRRSIIDQPRPLSHDTCPLHNFHYVAMPRAASEPSYGYTEKCPLNTCTHGNYER